VKDDLGITPYLFGRAPWPEGPRKWNSAEDESRRNFTFLGLTKPAKLLIGKVAGFSQICFPEWVICLDD
jgi:hypothetical protein